MCGTQSTGYTVLSPCFRQPATSLYHVTQACVNVRAQFFSCGFFAFLNRFFSFQILWYCCCCCYALNCNSFAWIPTMNTLNGLFHWFAKTKHSKITKTNRHTCKHLKKWRTQNVPIKMIMIFWKYNKESSWFGAIQIAASNQIYFNCMRRKWDSI